MKNFKWLRSFACLLLAVLMVVGCVGCKKNEPTQTPTDTSGGDDGEQNSLLDNLPREDWEGREVILATVSNWLPYMDMEAYSGAAIQDKYYERNLMFAERYNCEISIHRDDQLVSLIQSMSAGGSCEFDLIYPHPTTGIAGLLTTGLLADLLSEPIIDTDASYWNESQVKNYTTNGKLYLGVSDASVDEQAFYALVYNRDLYKDYVFEDTVDELVTSGRWTAEKMQTMLKQTKSDTDGGDETYGLIMNVNASNRWLYAMGGQVLNKKADGEYSLGLTQLKMDPICTALCDLFFNSGNLLEDTFWASEAPTSDSMRAFSAEKGLFMTWDLGSAYSNLRDFEFDIGYAPMPKIDEKSDYRVVCAAGFYAIPAKCVSTYQSALLLEFCSIYGNQYIKTLFYDEVLNGRLAECPEDGAMLEYLHTHKFFDIGYTVDTDNLVVDMLKLTVIKNKTAAGASVWVLTNASGLNKIKDLANSIGKDGAN